MSDGKPKNDGNLVFNTIQGIFAEHNLELSKSSGGIKGKQVPKRDLEIALAVLLVDIASADQHFDPAEYNVITNGLRRLFGTSKDQVKALVNQAQVQLSGLRGTNRFADLLRENLSVDEKAAVLDVIEEVIGADGREDGFETYLRQRLVETLGIKK